MNVHDRQAIFVFLMLSILLLVGCANGYGSRDVRTEYIPGLEVWVRPIKVVNSPSGSSSQALELVALDDDGAGRRDGGLIQGDILLTINGSPAIEVLGPKFIEILERHTDVVVKGLRGPENAEWTFRLGRIARHWIAVGLWLPVLEYNGRVWYAPGMLLVVGASRSVKGMCIWPVGGALWEKNGTRTVRIGPFIEWSHR